MWWWCIFWMELSCYRCIRSLSLSSLFPFLFSHRDEYIYIFLPFSLSLSLTHTHTHTQGADGLPFRSVFQRSLLRTMFPFVERDDAALRVDDELWDESVTLVKMEVRNSFLFFRWSIRLKTSFKTKLIYLIYFLCMFAGARWCTTCRCWFIPCTFEKR